MTMHHQIIFKETGLAYLEVVYFFKSSDFLAKFKYVYGNALICL